MASGAKAAVRTLKAHGLSLAFGMPGVQNLEYFDAFVSEGMEVVLVSHELAASFMADAVGRVTGKPGVVVVVPGPGLTNIFTGLGEALLDSAPMVVLVPGVRSNFKEGFQLHEIDHQGAVGSLSKCCFKVDKVDEIGAAVAKAVQCARSGEPGPVIVEVPYNVLLENTGEGAAEPLPLMYQDPPEDLLDQAADLILAAKSPGIHAGMGAADAADLVLDLAGRLDAPVSTTISGRGVIAEDHDLSVGFGFGPAGTALAEKIFKGRDLVIAVGCKFSEVGSGGYGLKPSAMIHLDANPEVLGRNFPAKVKIAGDSRRVLAAIIRRIEGPRPPVPDSELRRAIRAAHDDRLQKFSRLDPWPKSVNPARLFHELRTRAPRDAILTTDSGAHTFIALFAYDVYLPRTVLSPVDYSSMGYGLPAAIGASLAAPGRRVMAAVGDGGLLMTGTEMATAARLSLPLMVVLFNDRGLGLIGQAQKKIYRRETAVDTGLVDFEKFAAAFGFDYILIENDHGVGDGLDRAFELGRPVLVDARVEYKEITRHAAGTAMALVKRTPPSVILRMAARAAWRTLFE